MSKRVAMVKGSHQKTNGKMAIKASDDEFDRFLHFDSDVTDYFPVIFPGRKTYVGWVTYVNFQMSDNSTYEDLTAYLYIRMNNVNSPTTITQTGKKLEGHIFPIRRPGSDSQKCYTYIKGIYTGKEELRFSILDKELNPVDTKRIVVTLHLVRDTGQILVL